jgi:site-specific recombinase XerD
VDHRQQEARQRPAQGQKAFAPWRVHALACTLLDTGCRIDELLTAVTTSFEQDDLLLTVIGKGDNQRRVPFSIELRRVLFRYLQARERLGINDPLMLPSDGGGEWNQLNALRSFYLFQKRLGLQRVGFHRLRHTFATEYLRNGGDVVRLSRTLGHSRSPPPCATCRCSLVIFKWHMCDAVRWPECRYEW